ncbi:MAG: acyltransferase, partial [Armatimonadetes bacterium]|nr:acyltransferase [Akkermansiaceae bacterium]
QRGLRIIAPYYLALLIAFIFLAPELWPNLHWYLLYLTNFHIALIGEWPHGTSHFWSIAIQQQFYVIWPLIVWLSPRRFLALAMILFAAMAPLSRYFEYLFEPPFIWPDKISWSCFDFFGIGGLMALAIHRGFPLSSRLWKILGILGFGAFLILDFGPRLGIPPNPIGPFYATFLAIGLCGVIASASIGWGNTVGKILETRFLQKVGLLSYSIYLYHNLAPIILGKIMPFLWWGPYADTIAQTFVRIVLYAALTWTMTLASWKYLEVPLGNLREKAKQKASLG